MSLSVPLEPPSKEILHISAHYLVILVKYIYIQFNSIQFNYCLGSQGGKLFVAMRLLGPIACRNTAEMTENDQSVVLNRRLPVSTFSPNHWSCRCHLLAPRWAEIDRLASGAERAREIKEKKQLAIADAGAAAAAVQSEVREELAEAGN